MKKVMNSQRVVASTKILDTKAMNLIMSTLINQKKAQRPGAIGRRQEEKQGDLNGESRRGTCNLWNQTLSNHEGRIQEYERQVH